MIHWRDTGFRTQRPSRPFAQVDLSRLRRFFPAAESVAPEINPLGGRNVLDSAGRPLGYVLQTSPEGDRVIGFSGPTNVLLAFDPDDRILGIDILSSGDTREHVEQVRRNNAFLEAFNRKTWKQAAQQTDVDAVSGATLTSLAIQESIIRRLGGGRPSLRFPDPLTVAGAKALFPRAASVARDADYPALWHVQASDAAELGTVLETAPAADQIIGYQGPTNTRIGFDTSGRVIGISVGRSYDNEQYVTYVREDGYFLTLFNGLMLDALARYDLKEQQVEGVSGATMTSMAVAEALVRAARDRQQSVADAKARAARPAKPFMTFTIHDLGAIALTLLAVAIGLTSLRANKAARVALLLALVGYLGLVAGNLVSLAMLVGWARHGVPWRTAPGLAFLTAAAFVLPLTTRRNLYCSHLCPHGAAQQLLKNRLPWRVRLPRRAGKTLALLPAALLALCVIVAMTALPISLIDIEPFDAWLFRIAGWATVTIAIVGLVASLFVPMAYCRYGCPTGALLKHLRFHAQSDRWTLRDWYALALVALAAGLWIFD